MDSDNGEVTEVELLYRRHGAALLLFATSLTGERSRAQDAVQHVFLNMLRQGKLRQVLDLKMYAFACVRNAALNDARKRQRTVVLEEDSAWFDPPNRDYSAELNLRRALATLPDDQRQVTILHIWGDLTFSEIAAVLDISSNTAASRYRYALTKLREAMSAKEGYCAHPR